MWVMVEVMRILVIVLIILICQRIDTIPDNGKNILVLVFSFASGYFAHMMYQQLI